MTICISPSKSVMKQSEPDGLQHSQPLCAPKTAQLVTLLRRMGQQKLAKTLEISTTLGKLNYDRYQSWDKTKQRAALWMYSGDVYNGIDAYSLDERGITYAQDHLRVISGLYGLLRPLDAIRPYRLEMKLPIKAGKAKNLYEYWHDTFASDLGDSDDSVLLCASPEYAKSITQSLPENRRTITPRFMQDTADGLKEKGLFAKYARGALARYAIDHQITDPEKLKDFATDGMKFLPDASSDKEFVYLLPKDFTLAGRFKKL